MSPRDTTYHALIAAAQIVPNPDRGGLIALLRDEKERITASPGSRNAHHAWPGGYVIHVAQTLRLFKAYYEQTKHAYPEFDVPLWQGYEALLLHDIEKPWRYVAPCVALPTKTSRQEFRVALMRKYGIAPVPAVCNAIEYAEGEHDYVPGERRMNALASLVHAADIVSARALFDVQRA
jgi:hypothetical protein